MVLTITVVGNNQPGSNSTVPGHAVLSPNELAQLMSGQTVTGLLNPDGTITINSNVIPNQQMASMPANIQNGIPPVTSSAGPNYSNQISSSTNGAIESIGNIQPVTENSNAINNNCNAINNNNHSQTTTTNATTTTTTTTTTHQKKTGQKRLSAKQKLAQQQQQQQQKLQQTQQSDNRQPILNAQPDGQVINQQPQIVATVQLPNGQIGQLIAPSGGQFWSPNAINLQQLSMAVAAATGTIPQTMSIPATNQTAMLQHQQHQIESGNNMQSQQQHQQIVSSQQMQQGNQQQQQSSQQLSNTTSQQQQQVMTSVQMNSNQMSQVIGRPGQNQLWSGGPISLSQLSALAQQGVVQLSPVQGIPASGPNSQRVMEMLPQASIQGLINQNGQHVQAIPLAGGGQYIAQDPNDPNKWQLVQSGPTTMGIPTHLQQQQIQSGLQTPTSSINNDSSRTVNSYSPFISQNSNSNANNNSINNNVSNNTTQSNRSNSNNNNSTSDSNNTSNNHNINNSCNGNNTSRNSVLSDSSQSAQPQRKLKRLACTCPNCRDGDNSRSAGSDKKKQHICHFPDCNKVYGKTSHLRAHLRWHSGERPYVCNWSFCGKKFTRSDELQRHRRTHTGEKRFQCSECLKRFMRSDHLSKHLKTHLSTKKGPINQAQQLDHQLMQQQDDDNEHDHINRMNGITNMTPTTDQNNQIKLDEDMIDEKITIRSMSEDSVDQMQLLQQQQQQSENSSMGIKLNVNDSN